MEFFDQKFAEERDRWEREIHKNKLAADDEIEKQRLEYEKYLVDIRYINEQNKLKLLNQIEKLQREIDKYREWEQESKKENRESKKPKKQNTRRRELTTSVNRNSF